MPHKRATSEGTIKEKDEGSTKAKEILTNMTKEERLRALVLVARTYGRLLREGKIMTYLDQRSEWFREWYQKNRERILEYQRKRRKKKKEQGDAPKATQETFQETKTAV